MPLHDDSVAAAWAMAATTSRTTDATQTDVATPSYQSNAADAAAFHHDLEEQILVRIVSAHYVPWENHSNTPRSRNNSSNDVGDMRNGIGTTNDPNNNDSNSHVVSADRPGTRDVTPFLRALLVAQQHLEQQQRQSATREIQTEDSANAASDQNEVSLTFTSSSWIRLNAIANGQRRRQIDVLLLNNSNNTGKATYATIAAPASTCQGAAMDATDTTHNMRVVVGGGGGGGMNGIFGDPAPGMSKQLHIHYMVATATTAEEPPSATSATVSSRCDRRRVAFVPNRVETHTVTFAEHERVYLQTTLWNDKSDREKTSNNAIDDATTIPFLTTPPHQPAKQYDTFSDGTTSSIADSSAKRALEDDSSAGMVQHKKLTQTTFATTIDSSEIMLPLVMPYLPVLDRAHCRLVCLSWRNVIREWGIAVSVYDTDRVSFPRFTVSVLRGILTHSYTSLERLCLGNAIVRDLQRHDLHTAIPHWKKLQSLDISRCDQLDDSTLELLASSDVAKTLTVLYMKGLRRVSDVGVIAIARSCCRLQVLDISYLNVTDNAAVEIGGHLKDLRAIYMRDNYHLTNLSINQVTEHCTSLEQLTLWGCTRINQLLFCQGIIPGMQPTGSHMNIPHRGTLVLLNLWGCHSLRDDAANALNGMKQLRTLIVSECHRLTDDFVISATRFVPQISHLHLRYCKLISDVGLYAIAQSMPNLYSVDLSFCTKITISALVSLLEVRGRSLAELRLQACRTLDIARDPLGPLLERYNGGYAGRQILAAIRSHESHCCLSVLDVRQCIGQSSITSSYSHSDPFVSGMAALSFEQKLPGFFVRPARWNADIERNLVGFFFASMAVN